MALHQPQADLQRIGDAGTKQNSVDLLLRHGEKQPSDVLGVLRLGFGGQRKGAGIRLIVIAGKELPIVDLLQLYAVVIGHAIGRDRAVAILNELPCRFLAVQRLQLVNSCAAAVQIHVVVSANGSKVRKIRDDCSLLTAEGQVYEILQLEEFQLMGHCLKLRSFTVIEALQPFGEIVQLLYIYRKHLHALKNGVEAVDLLHLAVCLDRVADLQRLQQLHAVRILVM